MRTSVQCQLVLLMLLCRLECERSIGMMALSVRKCLSTMSAGLACAVGHAQVCNSQHLVVNANA